jgi:hypothetical protein
MPPCHSKGLATLGIKQLYSHQAMMFSEVDKGKNVIITLEHPAENLWLFTCPYYKESLKIHA